MGDGQYHKVMIKTYSDVVLKTFDIQYVSATYVYSPSPTSINDYNGELRAVRFTTTEYTFTSNGGRMVVSGPETVYNIIRYKK